MIQHIVVTVADFEAVITALLCFPITENVSISFLYIESGCIISTSNPQDDGIDIDSLDDGKTVWPFTSFATL